MSTIVKRAGEPEPASTPILTVCIPTYRRAPFVEAQVQSVFDHLLNRTDAIVELVVVNNKSPDDTSARLARFKHPRFRLIERTVHYDTAEENMIRSLEFVRGEYVWFLGDDDPIHVASINLMLSMLSSREYGCLIFNSTTIRPQGHVAALQPMPMRGAKVVSTIDKIVEMIGLVNTFAGISNIIHRTAKLNAEEGLTWMRTSKIYSHVAWFVRSMRGEKVAFVNSPIVFYRLNDYSDGHWDRVASRLEVPSLYFWSLGLVRLLSKLVDGGDITAAQSGQLFELAEGGVRYRLLDDIVFKTFQQLQKAAGTSSSRENMTKDEFEEIRRFCLRCDPSLYNTMAILAEAHTFINGPDPLGMRALAAQKMTESFLDNYNKRQAQGQFIGRFIARVNNFDVFMMPLCHVAVRSDIHPTMRHEILALVDPMGDGQDVLVAETFDGILEQIDALQAERITMRKFAPLTAASAVTVQDSAAATQALHSLQTSVQESANLNRALINQINEIYNSTSWQITSPLRVVSNMFRRKAK
jgi:glycosyltransferase involved in cell wall biosynthesis